MTQVEIDALGPGWKARADVEWFIMALTNGRPGA